MRHLLFLIITTISLNLSAQNSKELKWSDLVPDGLEFDDPFARLTEEQLADLANIANYKSLLKYRPENVDQALRLQMDKRKAKLKEQGLDADTLLSQRAYVIEMRRKNANAVVKEIHETKVSISGYLLPLNMDNEKSTEFLLVPWVGACIHTPPPPNNQIVHIFHPQGFKSTDLFQAVRVEGIIYTERSAAELYLVDGSTLIESSYVMKSSDIDALN